MIPAFTRLHAILHGRGHRLHAAATPSSYDGAVPDGKATDLPSANERKEGGVIMLRRAIYVLHHQWHYPGAAR